MYGFYTRVAQKNKRDSEVVNLFTLLGTMWVKAVHRTLMKSNPLVNFINVLLANFLYDRRFSSFFLLCFGFGKKFVRKMRA
jgi:hypothetical protein